MEKLEDGEDGQQGEELWGVAPAEPLLRLRPALRVSLWGKLLCSHSLWFLKRRQIQEWARGTVGAGPVLCRSARPVCLPPSQLPSKEGWKRRNSV